MKGFDAQVNVLHNSMCFFVLLCLNVLLFSKKEEKKGEKKRKRKKCFTTLFSKFVNFARPSKLSKLVVLLSCSCQQMFQNVPLDPTLRDSESQTAAPSIAFPQFPQYGTDVRPTN